MTYEEIVKYVKKAVAKKDVSKVTEKTAIQIDVTGEGSGAFYILADNGALAVEPYDYKDHDAKLEIASDDLIKVVDGKLDVVKAVTDGAVKVEGNVEKAAALASVVFAKKAAAKKAPAKKAAAPKAEKKAAPAKKTVEKKAEAPKAEKKAAPAKKAVEKKAEAPKAEKKVAPAKKAVEKKAEAPKAEKKAAPAKKVEEKKAEAPKVVEKKAETVKAVEKKAEAPKAAEAPKKAPCKKGGCKKTTK